MVEVVIETINAVLKEEGLEGIMELEEPGIDTELGSATDCSCYKSPLNEDGIYLKIYMDEGAPSASKMEQAQRTIMRPAEINCTEYVFSINEKEAEPQGVSFTVTEEGKLMEEMSFGHNTTWGHYFDGINAKEGADFAPVFRKMVELYKAHYTAKELEPAKKA